jgi:protein subunit release factor A
MYVADERFAANYGGVEGAIFVRDALRVYFGWGVSLNEAS